ncbi:CynX/NimT family MFS transporter [Sporosarcina sp. G11-34]|uniref:CynX/NimT family MFS transporter n=1 Tax=Sporosarcina sp. G11-34 TaxID=2849605 RepID=UPI0022A9112D|nr:MFS transporter [Sporosarcina sp. G11-34]MCZ2257850.1 MFS transporter [Sporosarcina sp. G11-34]
MKELVGKRNFNPGIGLLVIGIILLASNLRAPITAVGTLISSIRDSFEISNTVAGILTTLPLLAFAFISPFAAKLSRRFGMEHTIFISLFVLTLGIGLRSVNLIETLFVGTLLIGLAIAISNVLLPALIKKNFIHRIGLMTGVYAVSMNLSSAIASGISVPLASISWLGWQGALAIFGFLTIAAILLWIPQLRHEHKSVHSSQEQEKKSSQLWRSPLAWKVTFFMGLQSLIYYSIIAWFPEILRHQGLTAAASGWMISLLQFAVLPFTFIVPIIAGRLKDQRVLVAITASLFAMGTAGLLFADPFLIPLWMIFIGIACGCSFSLAMMFFSLRTTNSDEAAELSGMAQSFGYLLAAFGPLLFGYLRDSTGNWTIPLIALVIVSVFLFIFGMGAGKKGYVS